MILGYRDKNTERFARDEIVKRFEAFARSAGRRLALLDAAESLAALGALRGNRLEALKGDRAGQHGIRINDQWRGCFVWSEREGGAEQVEITDCYRDIRGIWNACSSSSCIRAKS